MQTKILGGGNLQAGTEWAVDPTFQAARIAMRPLDHAALGQVLGHYSVCQVSGATASLGAAGHLASIRWADSSRFLVLMRIKAGWSVTGAVTAATPMDMQAVIVRGFSVDFTTASTTISLAAISNTNKMRANMGTSLMNTIGPRIATTTVMSGQTLTADVAPFAYTVWANQPSGNATVTQAVGVAGAMQELYNWNALGQHPVVLAANEGIVLQPVTAGPTTGTVKFYVQWDWAEVTVF
jgi:hypothetical protein